MMPSFRSYTAKSQPDIFIHLITGSPFITPAQCSLSDDASLERTPLAFRKFECHNEDGQLDRWPPIADEANDRRLSSSLLEDPEEAI